MDSVYETPHADLDAQLRGVPLVLRASAVGNVLRALLAGDVAGEIVQRWASFVKYGFAPPVNNDRIKSLLIEYDSCDEDAIVEAVGRLDEIGDIVDGYVGPEEIGSLASALNCKL